MKNSELFRKTAKALIDKMPKGTQVRIADQLGISRPYMNDFLNGRKMLSESKREEIAEKLGYSYADFLILGIKLLQDELEADESDANKKAKEQWDNDDKRECALESDALTGVIYIIDKFLQKFESEISIKLSPKLKAKVIMVLYDCIFSNLAIIDMLSKGDAHTFSEKRLIDSLEEFDSELSDDWREKIGHYNPLLFKARSITDGYINPKDVLAFKLLDVLAIKSKKQKSGEKELNSNAGKAEDE